MKKYVAGANKFTNKATQLASKMYSDKRILINTLLGQHKGEPMLQVYLNIVNDPNVQFEEPNKNGNQTMLYKGKNVGWINFERGMGWIDEKAYPQIEKFDMNQLLDDFSPMDYLGDGDGRYLDDSYDDSYGSDVDTGDWW